MAWSVPVTPNLVGGCGGSKKIAAGQEDCSVSVLPSVVLCRKILLPLGYVLSSCMPLRSGQNEALLQ